MGRVFSGAVLTFLAPLAAAQNQVNMSPGVTEIGADIFELHMLIMWICVVIGVAVFAVMFYSIYAHRKSKGHQASQFHESTKVEVAWTVVPFLILIAIALTDKISHVQRTKENLSESFAKFVPKKLVNEVQVSP